MIKISQLSMITATVILSSSSFAEDSFEQELQQGCSKVKQYAQTGKKLYDQKQYAQAAKQFEDQAAWAQFCLMNADESGIQVSDREIEIANNNVGLSYAKLGKPQWARVWFLRDAESKTSQYNLKQLPKPKIAADLQGTYVRANGFGQWDYITVTKQQHQYRINFEGYYFGIRGLIYGPNLGEFDTNMPITAKQANYRYEDCQIKLQFLNDPINGQKIEVEQNNGESSCGFGHNVYAGGTFYKVESK
ncbi:hypothetical protein [Acinetobacter tjernbergiae]|uniref:Uncharacterized protein n=1 Tax=Acinetobacter tjernbergiae DSM 14971 = CIP 107465 TaxID=1120928 RepID=V2UYT3_9GAMM|nr:hypothetical protein [Acinetobacter tjernbergiae]ESK53810.1 hypothetical protein F990_03169 [Acinetobacter tjernbergiae DSM 14971 = CIP 107465]